MQPHHTLRAPRPAPWSAPLSAPLSALCCALALALTSAARGEEPAAAPPPPAPPAALEALARLKGALKETLLSALKAEGAAGALSACQLSAPQVTAAAGRGVEVGRASHKLRSPANAPRPWVAGALKEYAGTKEGERPALLTRALEGGRVGVLEPIYTQAPCLQCHGAELAAGVAERLRALYPTDAATGFALGEFRGFFWAEVAP